MTAPPKNSEIRLEASFRLYHPDKKKEIPADTRKQIVLELLDGRLTREQTTLKETQQEPQSDKLSIRMHQTHANLDDRPEDDNCRDPTTRAKLFQDEV